MSDTLHVARGRKRSFARVARVILREHGKPEPERVCASRFGVYRRARIRADVGQPVWHREFYVFAIHAVSLTQVDISKTSLSVRSSLRPVHLLLLRWSTRARGRVEEGARVKLEFSSRALFWRIDRYNNRRNEEAGPSRVSTQNGAGSHSLFVRLSLSRFISQAAPSITETRWCSRGSNKTGC